VSYNLSYDNMYRFWTSVLFLILFIGFNIPHVRSQPFFDAWFTHIYVTHGSCCEIDLIDGGGAKVYVGDRAVQRLVYYNGGIDKDLNGARLYTKIYRDGELVGTSTTTSDAWLYNNSSRMDQFSCLLDVPATYSYRVELWWYDIFTSLDEHVLVDIKEFELEVVELRVS